MYDWVIWDNHGPPHQSGMEVKCSCLTDPGIQRIPQWEECRCSVSHQPALVNDNATNMILADVEAEMSLHLMCTQKAFKRETVRLWKVVGFFYCSVRAAEILQHKEEQVALPSHKLIQDASTCWNSTHNMFEWILEQQPAIFYCTHVQGSQKRRRG